MKKDFIRIKEEMDSFDELREAIIKESRGLLKASKQAIYSLHRKDNKRAEELLAEAKNIKEALEQKITTPQLRTGGFSNACEEYAEAAAFNHFLKHGTLIAFDELGVSNEEYLGGLADLTGELGRQAVILATNRDKKAVELIKNFTEELYGEFVQFDFRNGELRRKYDSIKYNLQKMERVLYDLELQAKEE